MMKEFNDRKYRSINRANPRRLEIREKSRRQIEEANLRNVCNFLFAVFVT